MLEKASSNFEHSEGQSDFSAVVNVPDIFMFHDVFLTQLSPYPVAARL
jgi:hypothetical protein